MIKSYNFRKACILFFSLALLLSGCQKLPVDSNNTSAEFTKKTHRYLCIVLPYKEYYWGEIKKGISDADNQFGCMTKIETFELFDTDRQLELLKQIDFFHVDGVITIGQPSNASINSEIKKIVGNNIPVVLLDTDSPSSQRTCYIGTNNYKAGADAAKYILKQTNGSVNAAVFVSSMDNANQQERYQGFKDTIQNADGIISYVGESLNDADSFQDLLKQALQENAKINSVFCAEASTSQQAGIFLKNSNLYREITSVMFDDVGAVPQLVSEGILSGSIIQSTQEMGYLSVDILERINRNEEILDIFYTQTNFLTPESAKATITDHYGKGG